MTDRWQVASRANVPPFHVMDLLAASAERQRTHGDLVNLLAGQPMTGAPGPVNAEAIRLLQSGDPLGYTPATGIRELREAIAGHHRRDLRDRGRRRRRRGHDRAAAAGSCSRSWRRSRWATASRWPGPATPATATC